MRSTKEEFALAAFRHKKLEPHAVQKGKFVAIMRPMLVNTSVLTALLPFLAKNLLFLDSQTQCAEKFLFSWSCRVKQGWRLTNPERTAERKFNKHWAHVFDSLMPNLMLAIRTTRKVDEPSAFVYNNRKGIHESIA